MKPVSQELATLVSSFERTYRWSMICHRLLASVICFAAISPGQQSPPVNVRIFPSAVTQTEPVASVHPENPNNMFASAVTINTSNSFKSEGIYISTNAGLTWSGSDVCTGQLAENHGGDPGAMIHPSGRLLLTHIGSVFPGWYSHYSTDLGTTWSSAYTVSSLQTEDKGSSTMDPTTTSPFYGRAYAAWVAVVQPYPVRFSYSTNAGTSWSATAQINPAPPGRCSGGSVTTGRDGKVYVTWAGVTSIAPFTEDLAGFAVSSNGGTTWSVTPNAFDMNGIAGTLPQKADIKVNGLPQIEVDRSGGSRDGWLYVVTGERNLLPAGNDPDIILHRSTDGGQTWSAGIRVNQDPLNNSKFQWFPAMAIDQTGGVNIIFYDDRNTSADSAEIILARSTDGGTTWTERLISDHRFRPNPIVGGSSHYQGDHIALLPVGTKLYAFWMDDFSGLYQVWLAIIDLISDVVDEGPSGHPLEFKLLQNYPNPFNPTTTIEYSLKRSGHVVLRVLDVLGKEVARLINGQQTAGSHRVVFDSEMFRLASGVYFYQLSSEGYASTKSMILMR
jgi:hypothetical protein